MAMYLGDPRVRPELAYDAISVSRPIKRKRESLIGKMAVCWLTSNSHDIGPHHVVDILEEQLHISRHEVKVVKHFPEQYLVLFYDSRAYHRVLHHNFRNKGRVFNFEAWIERRDTVETMLEYRVRRASRACRTYDLWSWSSNPSKIPNKVLLTITDPDRELAANEMHHEPPHAAKGAFDYKLHLDVVEDLSFLHDGDGGDWPPNRKARPASSMMTMPTVITVHAKTVTTTTTTSTAAHGATAANSLGGGQQDVVGRWRTATTPPVLAITAATRAIATEPPPTASRKTGRNVG
uniref:DUF4283 domain-containing protein n=1 Tax=Setaria viridis TaxID=4556 RepID=A0A4U6VV10_SETVI|nr:hypothetical protein SEVIR_2G218800v2 [Setaria viridis]